MVFENKKAHIWHLVFDDVNNQINISKKQQYFEPVLTVGTIKKLNEYFRESLVIELKWEDTIKFNIIDSIQNQYLFYSRRHFIFEFYYSIENFFLNYITSY